MPRDSSHWYRWPSGDPFYETECSTIPGQMRAPTIRDARKMQAAGTPIVPSVTTVQRAVGKSRQLVEWLRRKTVEQSLKMTRKTWESTDRFVNRVVKESDDEMQKAPDLGTRVHNAIEKRIRIHVGAYQFRDATDRARRHLEIDADLEQFVDPAYEWFVKNVARVIALEKTFACRRGYGGKVDLVAELRDGRTAIIDWKTYGSKEKRKAYPEDGEQLIAYAEGLYSTVEEVRRTPALINIGISTLRPGEIVVIEHQNVESLRRTWQAKLLIWQEYHQFTLGEK